MPHKYITPQVLQNIEQEISVCNSSIERIKVISRGGKEALKELASQVKDFLDTAREKKNQALDGMMAMENGNLVDPAIQDKAAQLCRGQEKAFEIVLDMIENPDRAVQYYVSQKERFEKELARYRTFEQRKED